MNFGNSALLFGMALGVIPVIIHLINRHRAKLRPFAAIEFLLMSDKRLARRLKLKQLIVLILRVALLVLLALALAKPYLEPDDLGAPDASAPGAVVLIVDDSASMDAVGADGAPLRDKALAQARAIIGSGGPRTSFAVIASGEPARVLTSELTFDKPSALRALDRLDSAPRGGDLHGALKEAGRLLSETQELRRQILIVGDRAAHQWQPLGWPWTYVPVTAVDVNDVRGGEAPLENAAISGVRVARAASGGPNVLSVAVDVVNHGLRASSRAVTVQLGDKRVAEQVHVAPGARETVTLNLRAPQGVARGVASLDAADSLATDDTWYFTIDQSHAVNVLVVNGAPRSVVYLDELFFLRAALTSSGKREDAALNPVFVNVDELTPARIAPMDVVILANVGRLTPGQQLALTNHVEAGGGLLITAGDEMTDASNDTFGSLLPFRIRGVKTVAKADDPGSVLSALTLATADFDHPVLEVFDGVVDASLFRARVYSYLLLDTVGQEAASVVASYTGGIPGLVERRLGQGRVMMLTTTLDRDWSDLAIRTSFLPLVQRIAQYLAGTLEQPGGAGYVAGRPVRAALPEGRGELTLRRPDGADVTIVETPDDALAGSVFVEETQLPGHYALRRGADDRRAVVFAINADRRESELTRADDDVVQGIVTALTQDNGILPDVDPGADDVVSAAGDTRSRTLLWPYVLVGLLFLFGAEAWLLVRA